MRNYSRLAYEDRCRIEAFERKKEKRSEIARALGKHRSSIYRELGRNGHRNGYTAPHAERCRRERFQRCRRRRLLDDALKAAAFAKLEAGWSPAQISGRWKREHYASVSHETLYRWVRETGLKRPYLRFRGRRGAGRWRQRTAKPAWMRFIWERPRSVLSRRQLGHWERDTMRIADNRNVLVATERKSRLTRLVRMPSIAKESALVANRTLIARLGGPLLTLTNDRGVELRDGNHMPVPVYYCDPRRPDQRGTIENTIGLLRQYIGRSTPLEALNDETLQAVEDRLNHRPRRCLDWRTPYEVFHGLTVALAK